MKAYTESVLGSLEPLEELDKTEHGNLDALWIMLEVDYGAFLERSRALRSNHREAVSESWDEQLESLVESIQVFAIGRENFKTLYYFREVSGLSRTLLIVSLPAILVITMSLFAITMGRFPEFWLFGVSSLQIFVVTIFSIALLPYVVLTSFMLRLSTVGIRTASAGPFSLNE